VRKGPVSCETDEAFVKAHLPGYRIAVIDQTKPLYPNSNRMEDYEAFFDRAFEVLMALKFPTLVGLTEIPLETEDGFIYYPALLLDDSNPQFREHLDTILLFAPSIMYQVFTGKVLVKATLGGRALPESEDSEASPCGDGEPRQLLGRWAREGAR